MATSVSERVAVPLWRNVSFLLMWSSVAASGFADRVVQLAAWEICGISVEGSEPARVMASITFFFFLPYVLFGPIAGWLADTLSRKWIMLTCDEVRAALLLLAFVAAPATLAGPISSEHYWKVYAIIFGIGTMAAIFSPTKAAMMPQIVPVRQLQAANAIVLGIAVIAAMIGLKVGDQIIERQSVRGGLQYAMASFAISGIFFAFLKVRRSPTRSMQRVGQARRLTAAATYMRAHRAVALLVLQAVAFWAAAHLFTNALGTVCVERYGFGADLIRSKIANMQLAVGVGMLFSALAVAWINCRRESTWLALGSLMICGVLMLLVGINRSYGLGLLLVFAAGFFGNTAMICVATLTQSITPNYLRGRVFGLRDLLITITGVVVNLLIWRVPGTNDWLIPMMIGSAAVMIIVSGAGLWIEVTHGPTCSRMGNLIWRLARLFVLVWHRLTWVGRQNIPKHGPAILASNHTTALDPMLLQAMCPRIVRWVMLTTHEHWSLRFLWSIIRPITLDRNSSDVVKIRKMLGTLQADEMLGFFPEGGLQRDTRDLRPFQGGIGMLARRSNALIVPVWITGTPRSRHMLWHFLHPSRAKVIVGRPYRADPALSSQQIADDLRARLLELSRGDG